MMIHMSTADGVLQAHQRAIAYMCTCQASRLVGSRVLKLVVVYPNTLSNSAQPHCGSSNTVHPVLSSMVIVTKANTFDRREQHAHRIQDVHIDAAAVAGPRVGRRHRQAGVADSVEVPGRSRLPAWRITGWRLLLWRCWGWSPERPHDIVGVDAVDAAVDSQGSHLTIRQLRRTSNPMLCSVFQNAATESHAPMCV